MLNLINIMINGIDVAVPTGTTVLQACERVGIEIPRFCYHERLLVAGNCRMCLVEIVGSPKPQASCALPVSPGMKILTDTELVKKARESVMEFLLINHPLDCPICDQGGECDLQDQSMVYGSDRSRMYDCKRSVEDKYIGPLVKTVMTRCIHCTRCIRFASEVAGVPDLGTSSRGNTTEVGTYVEKTLKTELSGNLIDLCPVGALTAYPTAFEFRPWELDSLDGVDAIDGTAASIRVQTRSGQVKRVIPRQNDEINGEWLADKSRFAPIDGLKTNRFLEPFMHDYTMLNTLGATTPRRPEDKMLGETLNGMLQWWSSWVNSVIHERPYAWEKWQVTFSPTADIAIMAYFVAMKRQFELRGQGNRLQLSVVNGHLPPVTHLTRSGHASPTHTAPAHDYTLAAPLGLGVGIAARKDADLCVLIGVNTRTEAPLVNAKRREGFLQGQLDLRTIGNALSLTMPTQHISGDIPTALASPHPTLLAKRYAAKRPVLMIGSSVTARRDSTRIIALLTALAQRLYDNANVDAGWTILNALHSHTNSMGAAQLGIPRHTRWLPYFYQIFIGVNQGELHEAGHREEFRGWHLRRAMMTHGDSTRLKDAWFALPLPSYTENADIYVNTEGRLGVTTPVTNITTKWDLLSHTPQTLLWYHTENVGAWDANAGEKTYIDPEIWEYRKGSGQGRMALDRSAKIPDVFNPTTRHMAKTAKSAVQWAWTEATGWSTGLATEAIPAVHDYYTEGHPIARHSATMAKCSRELNTTLCFE